MCELIPVSRCLPVSAIPLDRGFGPRIVWLLPCNWFQALWRAATRGSIPHPSPASDHRRRRLARRETQTLGLIAADITNPFPPGTSGAIQQTARGRDYNVMLGNTDNRPRLQEE
jgi:hypothetical protein